LGEKLGILDPHDFENPESLRAEIVTIIEEHLSKLQIIPRAIYGEPFHFMLSRIVEVPLGLVARTLTEFREILATVDPSVVYYHTFEAMLRLGRRKGDFPLWIEEQLGLPELAQKISKFDFYMTSLETIRDRIIRMCDEVLEKGTWDEPSRRLP
jgi:Family of unknown function (DUF5752)